MTVGLRRKPAACLPYYNNNGTLRVPDHNL